MVASNSFRSYVWDPWLITAQILCLVSTFYIFLGLWMTIMNFMLGHPRTLDEFFVYQEVIFSSGKGRMIMAAFLINSLTCAAGLWVVVRRAKQCLDFSATVYFIHFLFCCAYAGFPQSLSWWIVNMICLSVMAITGEYLCMKTELAAIPVTIVTSSNSNNNSHGDN